MTDYKWTLKNVVSSSLYQLQAGKWKKDGKKDGNVDEVVM